jgi:hypothetical protein
MGQSTAVKQAAKVRRLSAISLSRLIKNVEGFVIFLAALLTIFSLLGLPTSLGYILHLNSNITEGRAADNDLFTPSLCHALGQRVKLLRKKKGYTQEDMISFGFGLRHWQQIEAVTRSTFGPCCEFARLSTSARGRSFVDSITTFPKNNTPISI